MESERQTAARGSRRADDEGSARKFRLAGDAIHGRPPLSDFGTDGRAGRHVHRFADARTVPPVATLYTEYVVWWLFADP
jgi:hypothetical protein